jgi:hypothetical protein
MSNWYTDGIVLSVQERLDKISLQCQGNDEVQVLISEITTILESAGTECPDHEREE